MKALAPSHTGGSGSANHGTLDQWRDAFPDAQVKAFGFSLGSGVKGDGVTECDQLRRHALHVREGRRPHVQGRLQGRRLGDSYPTTYRNQGECVSHFAKLSPKQLAKLK